MVKNAFSYISNQSQSAYSQITSHRSSNIPFATWLQWHWEWFLEHCSVVGQNVQRFLNTHCHWLGQFVQSTVLFFEQKLSQLQSQLSFQVFQHYLSAVDQTHVYFLITGVAIGFFIGIRLKQNSKPLTRMRALVCNSYKGFESIAMVDDMIAPTNCGPEDVLIQVKAASIDPMDIRITLGYGKVLRQQYHHYHKVLLRFIKEK